MDCPEIKVNKTTTKVIMEGYRLRDVISFECYEGHLMIGNSELICLWTGKWSSDPPTCEGEEEMVRLSSSSVVHTECWELISCPSFAVLYCPDLVPKDTKLQITMKENTHKGRAQFRCPRGHRIDGPSEIVCNNGTWSDEVPVCVGRY